MTTLRNKQYDPFHVLRTVSTFASEASNTLRRRFRGSPDKVWLQSSMYPDYYLNTFHYQVMTGSAIGTANCTWFDGTMVLFAAVTEACMLLIRVLVPVPGPNRLVVSCCRHLQVQIKVLNALSA